MLHIKESNALELACINTNPIQLFGIYIHYAICTMYIIHKYINDRVIVNNPHE